MDLSNLQPAEGSKHSDNFRRGRGHGSGNGKTAGKGHLVSKVVRCHYIEDYRREDLRTEIPRQSLESTYPL